jgi:enoyl-CoA hydratase
VTELHPREALLDASSDLADRIASRVPLSVEASKRMIRQAFDLSPEEWPAVAAQELSTLSKSADHKAGIKAFLSRQKPAFTRS